MNDAAGERATSDGRSALAAARLTIDLGALAANWRALDRRSRRAETAAVVKADAYGIGIENAVPALASAGCETFFVAQPEEGLRVRASAPQAIVYVLNGLLPRAAETYAANRLRPVLGSPEEIAEWSSFCRGARRRLPAAIHVDTGMNRLGLSASEVGDLAADPAVLGGFGVALVMSHLACADDPDDPMTGRQRETFDFLRKLLPPAPASLANSAGTLAGGLEYDLVRPGIALYGGRARAEEKPLKPVVRLEARILRIREALAGESVGYGAAEHLRRDSRLAIVALGYADGYLRAASSRDGAPGASAVVAGQVVPLVGRVSMDLVAIDVTDVPPDKVARGGFVEMIGPRFGLDSLAERAGTIGYEVLTRLGPRFERVVVGP